MVVAVADGDSVASVGHATPDRASKLDPVDTVVSLVVGMEDAGAVLDHEHIHVKAEQAPAHTGADLAPLVTSAYEFRTPSSCCLPSSGFFGE